MNEHDLIDYHWKASEVSARRVAMIRPNVDWIQLRMSIFEYHRKRHLNLDYSERFTEDSVYCWKCLAYCPRFNFC